MSLNPFNHHLMKHPLNWLIVVAVAVLGAMFIHHAMMVPAAVKQRMAKGKPQSGAEDDQSGGSFNT